MIKMLVVLLAVSVSLALVPKVRAISAFETSVAEIVQNPDKFNQGQVIVQGKAVQIQHKTSQQGSPFTYFFLLDNSTGDKIAVEHMRSTLDIQESALVTVQGDYYKKPTKTGFTHVIRAMFVK
ncbi:MAG TPA: hypothetical protein VE222_00310 [Nitrospiraceae bacterium]|nr:hypothetical protein [Nitrospiraceae bacterium]